MLLAVALYNRANLLDKTTKHHLPFDSPFKIYQSGPNDWRISVHDWNTPEGFKTSLTFKCLIEHLLADFSYSRPLDTYL